jgi:hypothetical protein
LLLSGVYTQIPGCGEDECNGDVTNSNPLLHLEECLLIRESTAYQLAHGIRIEEKNGATMRLDLVILASGLLFSAVGMTQEVRYVDLSGISQPASARPYGSRVENLSCGGSKELFPHRAKASLEWIEATDIYPRERIGMEVRVENVGTAPIKVPIHPNLADLKPTNPSARFEYYSLRLPLEAGVPAGGLMVAWLEVYGQPSSPIHS